MKISASIETFRSFEKEIAQGLLRKTRKCSKRRKNFHQGRE